MYTGTKLRIGYKHRRLQYASPVQRLPLYRGWSVSLVWYNLMYAN